MTVLTRRQFAQGLGIVVAFSLSPRLAFGQAARLPGSLETNRWLDAWIKINADGNATVCTGKVELGQGILTALWQIAADELDLPLSKVAMISGDTGRTPDEGVTSGSLSIEQSGTALKFACAEARAILIERAAQKLGASAEALVVDDGVIVAPDGRELTYAELAAEINLHREATGKIAPKPPAQRKIEGSAVPRRDIPAKVTGGATYVQDIRLPGMLHGRIVRPPRYDAKLESVDEAAVKTIPGVVAVVRDGSFLGVVAEREEQAIKARIALTGTARWAGGRPLPDRAKLYDHLVARPAESKAVSERTAPVPDGARVIEATYFRPYMAHGSIGPSCAVAQWQDGKLTVWNHSQGVFPLRGNLAMSFKLEPAAIRCIHVEGSGCYGHNGADDVALDAALLARALPGRPVRVQWMRDDEFRFEPYGPAMVMRVKAALSSDGRIVDWQYEVFSNTHSMRPSEPGGNNLLASWYLAEPQTPAPPHMLPQPAGGGDRNAIPLYDFPSQRVTSHLIKEMPLRVSALRTLGAYANVFTIESFMDELALAAGADPVAFRLAHLNDPRARAAIEAVAKIADWKSGEKSDGTRGRGIGFAKYKNLSCYVAVIADVEVDRASGRVRVPYAFAATDAGQVINPDGLRNQIEGGMIQSTSWTLHEEVQFDRERVLAHDWLSYPILTMPEAPRVQVTLIDRPEERPLGVGEGTQGPMAAAIMNAFANATGNRLRELPLAPERVKAALG